MPNRNIEFIIFTGTSVTNDKLRGFPQIQVIRSRLLESRSFFGRLRSFQKRVLRRDLLLERLLIHYQIDILSHSGWLGKNSRIATIGWIPDFQSFRLPNFFTSRELRAIKPEFARLAKYCSRLIVSSNDALQDIHKYLPEGSHKATVLRFAIPPISVFEPLISLNELKEKYSFSGDFLLLPNQLWMHKNHRVVIDALAILKARDMDLLVLSTGNTSDYRNPEFFLELESHIHSCGVNNHFRILGMIPYEDMRALMHYSLAIINPSLFEGWSTTVEEAKALGKTILLSDIAVHKEQNPVRGMYFSPNDPNGLAGLLQQVWEQPQEYRTHIDAGTKEATLTAYAEFAKTYRDIVESTQSAFLQDCISKPQTQKHN